MNPALTFLAALLLAPLAALHAASITHAEKSPNILLIQAGDLGDRDIACFRGDAPWATYKPAPPEVKAPRTSNLDRMAAKGRMPLHFMTTAPFAVRPEPPAPVNRPVRCR